MLSCFWSNKMHFTTLGSAISCRRMIYFSFKLHETNRLFQLNDYLQVIYVSWCLFCHKFWFVVTRRADSGYIFVVILFYLYLSKMLTDHCKMWPCSECNVRPYLQHLQINWRSDRISTILRKTLKNLLNLWIC